LGKQKVSAKIRHFFLEPTRQRATVSPAQCGCHKLQRHLMLRMEVDVAVDILDETLLTVADVARRLGIVPATVRHISTQGKLRALRTLSGVRIFLLRDVEQLEIQRATDRRKSD
jgi:hypothetical protein